MEEKLENGLNLEEGLDLSELEKFCRKFHVKFVNADITYERGFREPIYFFSDDLGGYTIDGIRNSLMD